jgi:VanZ family protein
VLYLWLPLVVWSGLIFFLSTQPDFPSPETDWLADLLGNSAHVVLFAVLAVLWARVLGQRPRAVLWACILTAVYALSDEIHQWFVPGRVADVRDLILDLAGALLGLWVWAWTRNRRNG